MEALDRSCAIRRRRSSCVTMTAATRPIMGKIALHFGFGASIASEGSEDAVVRLFSSTARSAGSKAPSPCFAAFSMDVWETFEIPATGRFDPTTVDVAVLAGRVEIKKRTMSPFLKFRARNVFIGDLILVN